MAEGYAFLTLCVIGLLGIVAIVVACTAQLVRKDSFTYDEPFVWQRKLPPNE